MTRPEPVEAYRLCDLPPGTKYRRGTDAVHILSHTTAVPDLVEVVEWPQRTYDNIPADDLSVLLRALDGYFISKTTADAAARIRAAIDAQEQGR